MKRALPLVTMLLSVWMAGTSVANATEYPLPPPDSRLIGENTTFTVQNNGKPLEDVAARFQIGLLGMLEANPGVDPYLPKPGTVLTIPTQMLLPDAHVRVSSLIWLKCVCSTTRKARARWWFIRLVLVS